MISKNLLLSSALHLTLAGSLIALVYQTKDPSRYIPFEVQLGSVHVHQYSEPEQKKHAKSSDNSPPLNQGVEGSKKEDSNHSNLPSQTKSNSASSENTAISVYLAQVLQLISKQKFYPRASLLNEESGTVEVKILIQASGQLEHAELKRSSGYPGLDAAALQTVRSIASFPPLPNELGSSVNVTVPIRYEVNPDH